jgi:hypothetical protein
MFRFTTAHDERRMLGEWWAEEKYVITSARDLTSVRILALLQLGTVPTQAIAYSTSCYKSRRAPNFSPLRHSSYCVVAPYRVWD